MKTYLIQLFFAVLIIGCFTQHYYYTGSKGGDNGQLIQFYSCDTLRLKNQIIPDKTSISDSATFIGNLFIF